MKKEELVLGIYEKALPGACDWRIKLELARSMGFTFVEMSIDESDKRLQRLNWTGQEKRDFRSAVAESGVRVPSICLSGHRRFPFGSHDPGIRSKAHDIMKKAINLADDLGVRVIQLAGYDVFYERGDEASESLFFEGLQTALAHAARFQVMLAMEIMDTPFMNSIFTFLRYKDRLPSPWFCLYPDLGNLSAWGADLAHELAVGFPHTVAIHLKDTHAVTADNHGQFRDVPFGEGSVDFQQHFRTLKSLGYTGPFLIEMWTEHVHNSLDAVRHARRWVLEQMEAAAFFVSDDGGETH